MYKEKEEELVVPLHNSSPVALYVLRARCGVIDKLEALNTCALQQ